MKTIARYFVIMILILGLTNCSTAFYTLTPDEESSYDMGREKVEKEDSLAYSSLSFEDFTGTDFIFNVYAYNKEQRNFVFDPSLIYAKLYDINKTQIFNNSNYAVFAIDPELQIAKIEESIDDRESSFHVATGLNIAFALLSTIVDLSDDEDNDTEEVVEDVVVFADNQINEGLSYENDIDYLKSNREYWKNNVLRKTELSVEEGVEGRIYIPFNPDAKYVKVTVPVGNTTHTYNFKQIEK